MSRQSLRPTSTARIDGASGVVASSATTATAFAFSTTICATAGAAATRATVSVHDVGASRAEVPKRKDALRPNCCLHLPRFAQGS